MFTHSRSNLLQIGLRNTQRSKKKKKAKKYATDHMARTLTL